MDCYTLGNYNPSHVNGANFSKLTIFKQYFLNILRDFLATLKVIILLLFARVPSTITIMILFHLFKTF